MTPVRSGEWPLTATGKVDRRALAERAAKAGVGLDGEIARRAPDSVDEEILASLWREALNLGRGFSPNDHKFSDFGDDFGRDDNFFDCGGESLRAAALLISVDKQFKRQFALREFFALPTFNNLLRLVEGASAQAANDQQTSVWPLPQDFRRHLLSYVEGWTGERVSEDRLMFGANRQGSLPPIFCVVNAEYEFVNLAAALGPEQPVYAFRSLYFVPDWDEDLIQALALRYVKDLEQVASRRAAVSPGPLRWLQNRLADGAASPAARPSSASAHPARMGDGTGLLPRRGSASLRTGERHTIPNSPLSIRNPHGGGCSGKSPALRSTESTMSFWTAP